MFSTDFRLDNLHSAPLYRQIYTRIKQAIMQRQLNAGERVPSVRSLASELGIARATVENAYGLLLDEGFLQSRGQAGTYVSRRLNLQSARPAASKGKILEVKPAPDAVQPELPLSFQLGLPALDAFPRAIWSRIVARRLRHSTAVSLAHPPLAGDGELRRAIAGYLQLSRGFSCRPEQVFICAGYSAVLDLIAGSLMQPGDGVWLEDPGYPVTQAFLSAAGATPMPVRVDSEGMNIDEAIARWPNARFAALTPTHQSPLGVSMSLSRRMAILAWAAEQQMWILEDDYDSEFRYQGQPLPSLKSLDTQERVLYAGTFSKVMFPALRIGYLVVPESLIAQVDAYCHMRSCACPPLLQASVADFIEQGHFYRHLKRMRQLYVQRRKYLTQAIASSFPTGELQVEPQHGGIQLCTRLDPRIADSEVTTLARQRGLSLQPLSEWRIAKSGNGNKRNGLLMGFTNIVSQQQAELLCQQLAEIVQAVSAKR